MEQVRRINERHQQLHVASAQIAAINVPTVTVPPNFFESINSASALAKQFAAINVPTVTVPPNLFESINSASALAKQFAAIRVPMVTVPPKLFESINAANALAKQFGAIRVPTVKHNKNFSEFLERTQPLTQGVMSDCENRPLPCNQRGFEFVPKTAVTRPIVRKLTPAQDVVTRIYEEFNRQRVLEEDRRHEVAVVITLLTGKRLLVESITTNGDHLLRVIGKVNSERHTEVVLGFASLQYEIITVERPPSRPDLKIVH